MDQTQLFGLESNLDIITNSREAKISNNQSYLFLLNNLSGIKERYRMQNKMDQNNKCLMYCESGSDNIKGHGIKPCIKH